MKNLSALLCAVLAFTAFSCGQSDSGKPKTRERPPALVSTAVAESRDIPVTITAIGTVEAMATVSVSSQVEGRIESVHFTEGQDVRKGESLFTMDKRPFQAVLDGAVANLTQAGALWEQYKRDRDRAESLFKQEFISRADWDAAVTKAKAQEAVIASYESAVDQAKLKLGYCEIRAPISGRTGSLAVTAGNVVKADPASVLVVIRQISPIYVRFAVPQRDLGAVRKAMAGKSLEVVARVSGGAPEGETGKLAFLDNSVDESTGTLTMKAVFPNADKALWPGQYADVTLDVATIKDAVMVPARALQNGPKGPIVFKVTPGNTVEVASVVPGESLGEDLFIKEGLAPGDVVVTEGALNLTAGAKIRLAGEKGKSEGGKPTKE